MSEENETETPAVMTAEEMKKAKEEYKAKKEAYKAQKDARKEASEKEKKTRDAVLDQERTVAKEIQARIFEYNKLGKSNKLEFNLLEKIDGIIQNVKDKNGEPAPAEESLPEVPAEPTPEEEDGSDSTEPELSEGAAE